MPPPSRATRMTAEPSLQKQAVLIG